MSKQETYSSSGTNSQGNEYISRSDGEGNNTSFTYNNGAHRHLVHWLLLTQDPADGSQYYEKTGDDGFAKYSAPEGGESVSWDSCRLNKS